MMELQTRLIRKAECNGSCKTSGGVLVGRRRIDEIVPSSPMTVNSSVFSKLTRMSGLCSNGILPLKN